MSMHSLASSISSDEGSPPKFYTPLGSTDGSYMEETSYSYRSFKELPEDPQQLKETLQKLDGSELYGRAQWALPRLSTSQFGKEGNTVLTRFVEGFLKVYKDKLEAGQQEQWEISYATHVGEKGCDQHRFKELRDVFNQHLQAFLGSAEQIQSVRTVDKAKDVAFTLFGGQRHIGCPQERHLARLVQVASDTDCLLIQLVMNRLRKEQEAYFTHEGFLGRVTKASAPHAVIGSDKEVAVAIAGGSRSIDAYLKEEADGRFLFGCDQPGLVVHIGKSKAELQSEAIAWAKRQYDDPVVYRTKVDRACIIQDEKGLYRIFLEHVKQVDLPEIELVDMQIDLLPVEDVHKLYPEASDIQCKRLETLLFGKESPAIPLKGDPVQPVKDEEVPTWKRALQVAGGILGGFLFYKYVVRPFLLKSQEKGSFSSPLERT